MSFWGKLIGAAVGYMIWGFLGALIGVFLGHKLDSGVGRLTYQRYSSSGSQERVRKAFFTATFSVMGYVAKSDGRVSEAEIKMANALMSQMQLSEEQRVQARELFNQGKQTDFDVNAVLDQFRYACHRRLNLIRMFLEIQIQAAFADGNIHAIEQTVLADIAQKLGFPRFQFEQLLQMIAATVHSQSQRQTTQKAPISDDYKILGVSRDASDAELKRAYRRLMSQHHPDKLVAKGLPEEMLKLATEKTQRIQAAYDQICEARK
ncbi:MAG: co-chaperone DjlA [Gammaproteobacteria bacterium]|nr:co-chaperone DjlA [Gammaproteobacteria bacterium]